MEIREKIKKLIHEIEPYDELEREQIEDAIEWIDSAAEIFRVSKPATPPKHLVIYMVLVDLEREEILLFEHTDSGLMLPSGGHAEGGELPFETAKRELLEELNIDSGDTLKDKPPFFLTQVDTVGKYKSHRDVDLWYPYLISSKENVDESTDDFKREYSGYRWMSFDEILDTDISSLDEHMHRFVRKLHKEYTN